jgi:peptidoglycan/LPS O-acetylase OafA/YrhL
MGLIRTLLALSIVIHHSFPLYGLTLLGREPALKSFYVISGFYMALILNEKYIGKNGGYKLFISNRFFRIFPSYWLILGLTVLFNYFFLHINFFTEGFFRILSDLTLIVRPDSLQINTDHRLPLTLPQAYTLVIELYFYLLVPFIARRTTKSVLWLSSIALAIHFIVFAILRFNHEPIGDWFLPEVIIYFLLGVITYKLYGKIKSQKISPKILYAIFSFVTILTVFYSYIPLDLRFTSLFIVKEWSYVLLVMVSIPYLFKLTNKMHWDRIIGELSYPIYLSHLLIISILTTVFSIKPNQSSSTLLIIVLTIVTSFLIFYFFEKPFETYRQSRLKKNKKKSIITVEK